MYLNLVLCCAQGDGRRGPSDPLYQCLPHQQALLSLISVCRNSTVMVAAPAGFYLYTFLLLVVLCFNNTAVEKKSPIAEVQSPRYVTIAYSFVNLDQLLCLIVLFYHIHIKFQKPF